MNKRIMKKIGILVGAAPIEEERAKLTELLSKENVYTVAADGGIGFFIENHIEPDEWIGDMDSADAGFTGLVRQMFPTLKEDTCSPIKDDTDTAIGVEILFANNCDEVYIFGGMGGARPEHGIANIQLMHHYAQYGKKIYIYSGNSEYYILSNETKHFSEDEKGYISVFSLTDLSEVDLRGLFYEYSGKLTNAYALGVSNEFCNRPASISVSEGIVLVIRSGKKQK